MPTTTILPSADFDDGGWATSGANHFSVLTPTRGAGASVTHDDATSYVSHGTGGATDDFAVETSNILPNLLTSLTSVDFAFMRARYNTGSAATARIRWNLSGTDVFSTAKTLTASFADYSQASPSRPGGGTWTLSDFSSGNTRLGVEHLFNSSMGEQVTSVWWQVTGVSSAGMITFLMSLWIPPLLAVASHGFSVGDLVTFFRSFRTRPSGRYELERVRAELLRRPVIA